MGGLPTNIRAEHIIRAIQKIEDEGVPAQAHSSTYDLLYKGKRFPPKLVLSYANIFANGVKLDRNSFSGGKGTPCFEILESNGFEIVAKDLLSKMLKRFLEQTQTSDLRTRGYLRTYEGLSVKVSFGQGNVARIPWISFLADGQMTSRGIYPVFLFYKDMGVLILAYGVSETNRPQIMWPIEKEGGETIRAYFKRRGTSPGRYGDSFVYRVYDIAEGLDYGSVELDLKNLIGEYKMILGNGRGKTLPGKASFDVASFVSALSLTGLIFSEQLVSRFVLSLLAKPFVILSGLAGSGKTQLAISFAKWVCEDSGEQICVVPVGADWTNREFLLGYPNALERGRYVKPDNGVLDLLLRAIENRDKPYFLILDEMNLSYVERYFADFLSALESGEEIPLTEDKVEGVPKSIKLPDNLFIIGTINVDETTYMFSPKVLDRANVIEFCIMLDELETYLRELKPLNKELVLAKGANQAASFVACARDSVDLQNLVDRDEIIRVLKLFFVELKSVHAEFGYRTVNEMFRFISLGKNLCKSLTTDMLVDAAIIQKLLPKLHGSRKKVGPVLKALWSLCMKGEGMSLDLISELPAVETMRYPLSAEKIWRMYRIAEDNGFTSFAEA
ncbi:MrcB family domain-containing protein [Coprobacter secundus]|uniref:MrcB family domain-containing protein n=1 Tax=Coprobacter secundus TaxID=1501392 RepID=UPI0023F8B2FD|nr:DUF3578 domain-containing protein [Coprobacter secundus]